MFLDEIREQLEKMQVSTNGTDDDPTCLDPEPGETFLADLLDIHRKLYALGQQYKNKVRQLESTGLRVKAKIMDEETDEKIMGERTAKECHEINLAINNLREKATITNKIFWAVVHDDFDHLIPLKATGIIRRKGNRIFAYYKKITPDFSSFLKGIMGSPPEEA